MIHEPRCLAFYFVWVRRCARLLKMSISLSRAELLKSQVFHLKEPLYKAERYRDLLMSCRFCRLQAPWQTAGQLFGRQANCGVKKLIALRRCRTIFPSWAPTQAT